MKEPKNYNFDVIKELYGKDKRMTSDNDLLKELYGKDKRMKLDDLPLFQNTEKKSKLAQAWDECKNKQPWLIPKLAEIARKLKKRGYTRYSISGLFHILRWETDDSTGDLGLKVNNNHQPFAARELMQLYPDLDGFFQLREQKPKIGGSWGQIY